MSHWYWGNQSLERPSIKCLLHCLLGFRIADSLMSSLLELLALMSLRLGKSGSIDLGSIETVSG